MNVTNENDSPRRSKDGAVLTECNACGGPLVPQFEEVRDPQTGDVFAIHGCTKCGLGHSVPQPEDVGAYYGEEYYGERHGFTKQYCLWRRVRLLDHAVKKGEGEKRLLDVGCGDGSFLQSARSEGWKVTGTELGQNADRARNLGIDVRSDLDDAKAVGPFDVITMWHSLEHFTDPKRALEQARELLAPGGTLLVSVPNAGGFQARMFRENWFHLDVPRHLFHFTQDALANVLSKTGFRVDEWRHQELELDLFGWIQSALNSFLPTPNTLFHVLTGKPSRTSKWEVALSYASGAVLGPLSVPATAVASLAGKGGTLIAFAHAESKGGR